jgi:protein-disulfide isomerase
MSKKHRGERTAPTAAPASTSRDFPRIFVVGALALLLAAGAAWLFAAPQAANDAARLAALQRPHAATTGSPGAAVHIVEFLDPACSTCREFYPYVKGLMKDNPGNIRLSVRMVAFHPNADVPVKALEAAKLQGKFWEVLEALLATQPKWVVQHRVDPDGVWAQLRMLDLDLEKLRADMQSPGVLQNIATDAQDAKTVKVKATPEYFVNGRGLPEFGYNELRALVRDELGKSRR